MSMDMNTGMNMDLDMDMFVDMDTDPDILKKNCAYRVSDCFDFLLGDIVIDKNFDHV
jgi:hypothetical protein